MTTRAKNITTQELEAIVNALPKRGEFSCHTVKSIAASIAPRLTTWQLEGLSYDLKMKKFIHQGRNRNWYKVSIERKPIFAADLPIKKAQELFTPVAETQPQNSAEKTYTKAQVIEAFKVLYVREYGKLDNKAYMFAGMLESAL